MIEFPQIYRTALLMTGSVEEAKDLAQDTFARLLGKWERVSAMERPGAYAQATLANLVTSWQRKVRVALKHMWGHRPPAFEPDIDLQQDVARALDRLTPAQRAALVLRYLHGYSAEEVGTLMGRSPGAVRALALKGLTSLRRQLDEAEEVNG